MAKQKPKVGDVVEVEFLDHVENSDTPLPCIVYGRVRKLTEATIAIESWTFDEPSGVSHHDFDNRKVWGLIRDAVLRIEVLKRGGQG